MTELEQAIELLKKLSAEEKTELLERLVGVNKGAGVKVKVIDTLSSGTCVIGTDIAFEGIEDNAEHGLFFFAESPEEFADILNNWQTVDFSEKQAAADEFFARYNSNHFADLLSGGRL